MACRVVVLHPDSIKTYGRNNQKTEKSCFDHCLDNDLSGSYPFVFDYYHFLSNRLYLVNNKLNDN